MSESKSTFALFYGNRGLFPPTMIADAREELPRVVREMGHEVIMLEEEATNYGAVETTREGQVYANFLQANRGKYNGVIASLPNFGDETGAVAALKEAGVPILLQAYPDDMDRMAPAHRRDAFCGKLSIADVFRQYGVKFSALKPHVVKPDSQAFRDNLDYFDRVCQVVKGMKSMTVGAIGARTTPFKTVRIDELALQSHGITVETLDLSTVIGRVKQLEDEKERYKEKVAMLREYTNWQGVPEAAFENIARLSVVIDEIIEEYQMDAIAIRCWLELQEQLGISPCVMVGTLNNQGIGAACEVDLGSAIALKALNLVSYQPVACLDWNNNYGEAEDKCILFHCGPVPAGLMAGKGRISDHDILMNEIGEGKAFGCHVGRIDQFDFTFGNLMSEAGALKWYLGVGQITEDEIPADFFGVAGVAQVEGLQEVLLHVMRNGHRHHVNLTRGIHLKPLREALEYYLEQQVALPQKV
jgi:L-fucose isomerase-like protein